MACALLRSGRTFLRWGVAIGGIDTGRALPNRNGNGQENTGQRHEQHELDEGQSFSRLGIHSSRLSCGEMSL
jgi:hypothetical protein